MTFISSKQTSTFLNASFFTSVFNLMNAILGAGIVSLPFALSNLGYIFFGILILIVAILALYDISLLLHLCDRLDTTSYERIATLSFGKAGKIYTCLMIFLHTLFAICGFMFMVRYEGPPLIEGIINYEKTCSGSSSLDNLIDGDTKPWYLEGTYLVILTMVIIVMPLSILKNIDFLGYTSGLSMLSMLVFMGVIVTYKFIITCPVSAYEGAQDFFNKYEQIESDPTCSVENIFEDYAMEFYELASNQTCLAKAFNWNSNSAFALPTMLFAFQCHASFLPIYSEYSDNQSQLNKNTSKISVFSGMIKVSVVAISAVLLIFCAVSYFAYFTWYDLTLEEVLMMYTSLDPTDPLIITARFGILICVILSAPLLHFPCRKAIIKLFWKDDVKFSWIRHISIMLAILVVVTGLVILLPGIQVIFGFAGAITANSLMIILPNLFYWKIFKNSERKLKICLSLGLAIIGVVIMVGNTALLTWSAIVYGV